MRNHSRRCAVLVVCCLCWGGLAAQARAESVGSLDGGASAGSLDGAVIAFTAESPTDGPGTNITTSGGGCAVAPARDRPASLLPMVGLGLLAWLLTLRRWVPRL